MEQSEQNWLDVSFSQEDCTVLSVLPSFNKKVCMPDLYKVKQTVQAARGGWYDPYKACQMG